MCCAGRLCNNFIIRNNVAPITYKVRFVWLVAKAFLGLMIVIGSDYANIKKRKREKKKGQKRDSIRNS